MTAAELSPQFVSAKTAKELAAKMRRLQASLSAKVPVIAILYAAGESEPHICWFYAPTNLGAGIM